MKQTFTTRKLGAVAATLGAALALGGTSYAVAQTGTDIVSRSATDAATSVPANHAVLARSWVHWTYNEDSPAPALLPEARPRYSQVNLQTTSSGGGGGSISVPEGYRGQAHAQASVLLQKGYSAGPATVTCDLRMTGEPMSNQYVVTLSGADNSRMTIPLVGSRGRIPAGSHNVGVACWTAPGQPPVLMQAVDLHGVVYDEPV